MTDPWSIPQVEAAAPDAQVRTAGRKLARPQPWGDVGISGSLLWGSCQGSGKNPYQVSIDITGPRYRCSCPSRKFPCKHAVALLFLWAEGHVSPAGLADFAAEWAARSVQAPPKPEAELTEEEKAQRAADAAKRLAAREARVNDGLAELDRFLVDHIDQGLATASTHRLTRFTEMAARMVDQQAPGVAGWLRELASQGDREPDWPERLTDQLGLMRLLIRGWQRQDELPEGLRETVRNRIGFTQRTEDVLAGPGVADDWAVIGMSDSESDQVSTRRVWLWGQRTGRPALVLFFAAGGAAVQSTMYPGTSVAATLHFYPGSPALRAVVGERGEDRSLDGWVPETPATIEQARAAWHAALRGDPWLDRWPVLVTGRLMLATTGALALADATGAVPVIGPRSAALTLLAASGGGPAVLAGEIGEAGFLPTLLCGDTAVVPTSWETV
ncbi:MAG: SWIM zinc finger domain-containing protein [Propioniciclava sp.]